MTDKELADEFRVQVPKVKKEIQKVIVGQEDVIDGVLSSIFCNGHTLLVGVPGLAKTLLIQTMASVMDLSFNRIQFTPDLMPSDIIGSEILGEDREFRFLKGPVFSNIVLADEINRTPPKTQAALLEAMQERHITVGGKTHYLPDPFFVLATQNPIEQEGTYPLPEAQLDRFMFNIVLDYPSFEEEVEVVRSTTIKRDFTLDKVLTSKQITDYQNLIYRTPVADNVLEYAVKIVTGTRPGKIGSIKMINEFVSYGAGPRASQYLIIGAKCHALMNGKYSPDIEDVQAIAKHVLRHRVVKSYRAEAEGVTIENIIENLV
jgi:MoxR-like ATPase